MTNKKNGLASMGGVTPSGDHNNAIGGDKRKPRNKGVSARPGFLGASATNPAEALSESQRLVFETIILEAKEKVEKLVKRKRSKAQAIEEVADEMDLTFNELEALKTSVEPMPEPVVEPEALVPGIAAALPNTITFKSVEEADQAAGILMYKSVPWSNKSNGAITFEDKPTLDKAHEALKRRWDFVETAERKVAVIEFDSLGEYERVVDFMQRSGMLLDFAGGDDLSEDILDELKAATVPPAKGKKAKPINEDDITAADNSYTAVNKDQKITPKDINIWDNRAQRVVKARKRWK